MKRDGAQTGRECAQGSIGEMMLAKTVIEEKNALLDQKDEEIRKLRSRNHQLESRLAEAEEELDGFEEGKAAAVEQATAEVIKEGVVRTYDMGGSNSTLELARAIAAKL